MEHVQTQPFLPCPAAAPETLSSEYASKEEEFMANGPLTRLFFTFALPGVCGILFISLQTLADGLLLGHFAGAASMAAINVALPCISLLIAVSLVVSVGCETLVSIGMGRGERDASNDALTTSVLLGAGISGLWGALVFAFAPQIVAFSGADAQLLPLCVDYLRAFAPFFPVTCMLFTMDYVLKALGRPLYAVTVMTSIVVLNVVLDILFIVGFGWGVTGAAVATGISYAVGLVANLVPLCSGRMALRLTDGRFRFTIMRRVLACGSAEGFSELAVGISIMLYNIMLMRYAGGVGIAAFTILNYMQYVAMATFLGTADGIRPVVGYNYGRRRNDRVRGIMGRAIIWVLALGALSGGTLFIFAEPILHRVFSSDDGAVISMAHDGARFIGIALFAQGLNIVTIGFFTSLGKPRVAGILALTRSLVLVTAGLFILPHFFGVRGIWMVPPMAELLTLLISVSLLTRQLRKA